MKDETVVIVSAKMPEEFTEKVNAILASGHWRVTETEMSVTDHHYFAMLVGSRTQSWLPGFPDRVYGSEWFLAKLKDGKRAVLRALPEGYNHDYKTADETYFKRDWVISWMQMPDSEFVPVSRSKSAKP